ncbi:sugar-binding protein [Paenibacillus roseipurpureus]|uniref:Probable pectate lyase C n=1 Tax=Paenibacillus roseopurpureus TaxID=2918901 RepID=A0AA96RLS1_9BACL|nr:sugar-binding protein [Paenibacillus sp. MBLB1832]WNR43492.1 sugar-binding protein [Paenibacillus sp. MBLB1832]
MKRKRSSMWNRMTSVCTAAAVLVMSAGSLLIPQNTAYAALTPTEEAQMQTLLSLTFDNSYTVNNTVDIKNAQNETIAQLSLINQSANQSANSISVENGKLKIVRDNQLSSYPTVQFRISNIVMPDNTKAILEYKMKTDSWNTIGTNTNRGFPSVTVTNPASLNYPTAYAFTANQTANNLTYNYANTSSGGISFPTVPTTNLVGQEVTFKNVLDFVNDRVDAYYGPTQIINNGYFFTKTPAASINAGRIHEIIFDAGSVSNGATNSSSTIWLDDITIKYLPKADNKSDLQTLYNANSSKTLADCGGLQQVYSDLTTALTYANTVLSNSSASQYEIDTATNKLKVAALTASTAKTDTDAGMITSFNMSFDTAMLAGKTTDFFDSDGNKVVSATLTNTTSPTTNYVGIDNGRLKLVKTAKDTTGVSLSLSNLRMSPETKAVFEYTLFADNWHLSGTSTNKRLPQVTALSEEGGTANAPEFLQNNLGYNLKTSNALGTSAAKFTSMSYGVMNGSKNTGIRYRYEMDFVTNKVDVYQNGVLISGAAGTSNFYSATGNNVISKAATKLDQIVFDVGGGNDTTSTEVMTVWLDNLTLRYVPKVDKTLLQNTYNQYKDITGPNEYVTPMVWALLSPALVKANTALNNANLKQEELDSVLMDLKTAAFGITGPRPTGYTAVSETTTNTVYLSPNGTGNGSSESTPAQGIQNAINTAITNRAAGQSTRIVLLDGTYTERVSVAATSTGAPPIILEAKNPGMVKLTGAKPVSGFSKISASIFSADLPADVKAGLTVDGTNTAPNGLSANPFGTAVKDNGQFQNGLMRSGNSYYFPVDTFSKMVPGSFYIDYAANKIYAKVPSGDPMSNVSVAVSKNLFSINGVNNFVLRGIRFEDAGWASGDAVTISNLDNVLIEKTTFNHNRFNGLGIAKLKNATFREVEISYNGNKGGSGSWAGYLRNIVFDNVKFNYNNWVGYQFGFTGWDPSAFKFSSVRDGLITNSQFIGNYAHGAWLDTDNSRLTIENSTFAYNFNSGIDSEANEGPIIIKNNDIYENTKGLYLPASMFTTVDHNNFYDNGENISIFDHGGVGRGPGTPGQYDYPSSDDGFMWKSHTTYNTFTNNVFQNRADTTIRPLSKNFFYTGQSKDAVGYTNFVNTLNSNNNVFFMEGLAEAFNTSSGAKVDLSGWQAATGQDAGSRIEKVATPITKLQREPLISNLYRSNVSYKTSEVIDVDGYVDEIWNYTPEMLLNNHLNGDTTQAAVTVQTLYDTGYVYALAKLPGSFTTNDSVTFFFDQNYNRSIDIQSDDIAYTVKLDGTYSGPNGLSAKVRKVDGQYILEAAMPVLNDKLTDANKIGFDVYVNKNGVDILSWNDIVGANRTETTEYGSLYLVSRVNEYAKIYKGTPTLDAQYDSIWDTTETLKLSRVDVVKSTPRADGDIKFLWDEDRLYFYADIKDSTISYSNVNLYNRDHLEIFLDVNNGKTAKYEGDDGQYMVDVNNNQGGNLKGEFKTFTRLTNSGYVIEGSIALNNESPFDANTATTSIEAGHLIGLDVQLGDDPGTGTRDFNRFWNYVDSNKWQNTNTWGVGLLVDSTDNPTKAVESIEPVQASTFAGVAPVLPSVVNAVYNTGEAKQLSVVWNPISPASYAGAGTFTVNGMVAGTTIPAVATVTVIPVQAVSLNPVQVVTLAGWAPELPATVTAVYNNGTTAAVPVSWAAINPYSYAKEGNFTVTGTVYSTSISAVANVVVTNTSTATLSGSDRLEVGTSLVLSYNLAGVTDVSAQDITLSYDSSRFDLVSATAVPASTVVQSVYNRPDAGTVRLIVTNAGSNNAITGNASNLLNITFMPKQAGTWNIGLQEVILSNTVGTVVYAATTGKTVLIIDTSGLSAALASAQAILSSAVEGVEIGQYPAGTKAYLNAAIGATQGVRNSSTATNDQIIQATADLNAAIAIFQILVITAKTGDFNIITGYDIGDLGLVVPYYKKHVGDAGWSNVKKYDINGDGEIGLYEIAFITKKILRN